jgi:hypothetical protein
MLWLNFFTRINHGKIFVIHNNHIKRMEAITQLSHLINSLLLKTKNMAADHNKMIIKYSMH